MNKDEVILNQLKKRLIDITYKHGMSHLSSTLSALPIIWEIYNSKQKDEVFILSNGHAGLALYVVIEFLYGVNAEYLLGKHGIHPSRDIENHIYCSGGSLGCGIGISAGMALADRSKKVYCMISDGECGESNVFGVLALVHKLGLENLKIYVNVNGISAISEIDVDYLIERLNAYVPNKNILHIRYNKDINLSFTQGIESHYHRITEEEYLSLKQ